MTANYLEMNGSMVFMVVDPDTTNAEAMKMNLKKMGYKNFVVQPDAFEAMNYIRSSKVDFVLSKMQLVTTTGTEFLEEMKNDFRINRLPFLLFSEKMDDGDIALVIEAGVDAHLTIPFVTKVLAEKVMSTWSRYIDPKNIEYHFEKARKEFLQNNVGEAEKIFQGIEKGGKLVHRASIGLARCSRKRGDLGSAETHCQKAIQLSPQYVHGYQLLGEILLDKKNYIGALEAFGKALEISPKNPYRYQIIGEILVGLKLFDKAEEIYRKAQARDIAYNFVLEGLASTLVNLNKKSEAIAFYDMLIAKNPKMVGYLNNVAVCYKSMDNYDGAIEYYKRALDLDAKNTKIMFNLALAYLGKGKEAPAKARLREILTIDPDYDKAKLKLLQLEDPEEYKKEAVRQKEKAAAAALAAKEKAATDAAAEKASVEASPSPPETLEAAPVVEAKSEDETLMEASSSIISEPVDVTGSDRDKIGSLMQVIAKAAEPAKSKALDLSLKIDDATKEKIQGLNPNGAKYLYLQSISKVRQQTLGLMSSWFKSVTDISEELVTDISNVAKQIMEEKKLDPKQLDAMIGAKDFKEKEIYAQIKSAMETDSTIGDHLVPIIMELQFQDHMRQSLECIQKGFDIVTGQPDLPNLWEQLEKILVSEHEKNLHKKIILGMETVEENAASGGDVLLF